MRCDKHCDCADYEKMTEERQTENPRKKTSGV